MNEPGPDTPPSVGPALRARRLGIDTSQEAVIYMRTDCHVCRAEGFATHARVRVSNGQRSVIATLNHVTSELLAADEVGLSEAAWTRLHAGEGTRLTFSHPQPVESLGSVRGKIYGNRLDAGTLHGVIADIVGGRYSDIHLSSFLTACSARELDLAEMTALTRAMVDVGDRLDWGAGPVLDKHCVGGLPGNRTTPIVVAVAAASGLTIPKTSSRAITSPAGTADAMETLAPVDLDLATMRRVVEREGGCVVWGGAVRLSPADDILIRVERALELDSEGQLVASVLSKKIAAGATHVVLDLPVGETAKVRGERAAAKLARQLRAVAREFALQVHVVRTDGSQPVGRGIGPALEAKDVLAVLRGEAGAPADLRERALVLAGELLELGGAAGKDAGYGCATAVLASGEAWRKFERICEAQGGMRTPPDSVHRSDVTAERGGSVARIDNRRIARVAKLAGAPAAKAAGIEVHRPIGARVERDEPLYTIHAESRGELDYALDYAERNRAIFEVAEP